MRNQIIFIIIGVIAVAAAIFLFSYEGKAAIPEVGSDGSINGNYALEGIMRLDKPYVCTFEKADESSQIAGILHTDGKAVHGEIRVSTNLVDREFTTFLVIKNNESFVWTSLPDFQDIGYKFPTAKSTSRNAAVYQQAQIIGLRDKVEYNCQPWAEVDSTIFDIPDWMIFSELQS
jgi:hypothetical protein